MNEVETKATENGADSDADDGKGYFVSNDNFAARLRGQNSIEQKG